MVIFPCGWESLCLYFREYLGVSLVFIGDHFEVFVLICFYHPLLGEISSIDDYLISFLPLMCPLQSAVHIFGRSDEIRCHRIPSCFLCGAQVQGESVGRVLSPVNLGIEFVEPGESEDEAIGS